MPALPTPGHIPLAFADPEGVPPVVRIPVAGPAPFTTLAVFTHRASGVRTTGTGLLRIPVSQLTPLTINEFDPFRAEQRRFVHSCSALLWRMRADDSASFVWAADQIARPDPAGATPVEVVGAAFDDDGTWSVQLDTAQQSDAELSGFSILLRCWVLFVEATPPPPQTAEQTIARARAFAAAQRLAAYRHYLEQAGADAAQAAAELVPLARDLARSTLAGQALEAQRLVVKALGAVVPGTPEARRDHAIALAEARHDLIARLVAAGQVDAAMAALSGTVAAYRAYAALDGADVERAARDLRDLAVVVVKPAQRPLDALAVQEACVALYERVPPRPDDGGALALTLTEVRHDLIARLVDSARAEATAGHADQATARTAQAGALSDVVIAGYRAALRRLDGDAREQTRRDLGELVGILAGAGLAEAAASAQRVLDEDGG